MLTLLCHLAKPRFTLSLGEAPFYLAKPRFTLSLGEAPFYLAAPFNADIRDVAEFTTELPTLLIF
jgi:hypothetical protein